MPRKHCKSISQIKKLRYKQSARERKCAQKQLQVLEYQQELYKNKIVSTVNKQCTDQILKITNPNAHQDPSGMRNHHLHKLFTKLRKLANDKSFVARTHHLVQRFGKGCYIVGYQKPDHFLIDKRANLKQLSEERFLPEVKDAQCVVNSRLIWYPLADALKIDPTINAKVLQHGSQFQHVSIVIWYDYPYNWNFAHFKVNLVSNDQYDIMHNYIRQNIEGITDNNMSLDSSCINVKQDCPLLYKYIRMKAQWYPQNSQTKYVSTQFGYDSLNEPEMQTLMGMTGANETEQSILANRMRIEVANMCSDAIFNQKIANIRNSSDAGLQQDAINMVEFHINLSFPKTLTSVLNEHCLKLPSVPNKEAPNVNQLYDDLKTQLQRLEIFKDNDVNNNVIKKLIDNSLSLNQFKQNFCEIISKSDKNIGNNDLTDIYKRLLIMTTDLVHTKQFIEECVNETFVKLKYLKSMSLETLDTMYASEREELFRKATDSTIFFVISILFFSWIAVIDPNHKLYRQARQMVTENDEFQKQAKWKQSKSYMQTAKLIKQLAGRECSMCHEKVGKTLQICNGCHCTYYCSKKCESQHWKTIHKFRCASWV